MVLRREKRRRVLNTNPESPLFIARNHFAYEDYPISWRSRQFGHANTPTAINELLGN